MNLVLEAQMDFAKSITAGKQYIPSSQTATGFLIKGDDGNTIDLYYHFFKIGIQDLKGNITFLPQQKSKFTKEVESVEETPEVEEKPVVVNKDEPHVQEQQVETENKLINDLDEDDDF